LGGDDHSSEGLNEMTYNRLRRRPISRTTARINKRKKQKVRTWSAAVISTHYRDEDTHPEIDAAPVDLTVGVPRG